ncbi:MAG TPA: FCD domain-containing protein [Solirubrobacteraceae bacterium]|jgi:DNA-binding FadR family transcriptional regulator|nr:FCD domain-containing protein [Solirubrobacteraceae bacterium]
MALGLNESGSDRGRGRKISEVLAREILKDASRRGLEAGDRLQSESEMIEHLGVGRGSVREALRILEVQGLLRIRSGPGGGPVLRQASSSDYGRTSTLYFMAEGATYSEVIEARAAMTGLMARLAAERAPAGAAERLAESIAATEQVRDRDGRTWSRTASDFYTAIAEMCQNRVVALFCLALMSVYLDHLPPVPLGDDHRQRVLAVHRDIARAVGRGDGEEAERLMTDHLLEFAEDVRRAFPGFMDEVVDWD